MFDSYECWKQNNSAIEKMKTKEDKGKSNIEVINANESDISIEKHEPAKEQKEQENAKKKDERRTHIMS